MTYERKRRGFVKEKVNRSEKKDEKEMDEKGRSLNTGGKKRRGRGNICKWVRGKGKRTLE